MFNILNRFRLSNLDATIRVEAPVEKNGDSVQIWV